MASNISQTQEIINSDPHASYAENFHKLLDSINPSDIHVFIDGSKATDRNLGMGFNIFQLGLRIHTFLDPWEKNLEVHNAEVLAALYEIRDAITLSKTHFANDLWLFLDNKEVDRTFLSKPPAGSL